MKTGSRTKFTILGILALSPSSGYEIIKMIQTSTNYFWSESEGQIYPALAQCVKEELATCKEENTKGGQRVKKIYAITAKGKKTLNEWLQKEPQVTLVRNELLLKLFFGHHVDTSDSVHHLMHHKKEAENELTSFEEIRKQLLKENKNSPHLKYWLITLDYGIKTAKAQLLWCKESIKSLESE